MTMSEDEPEDDEEETMETESEDEEEYDAEEDAEDEDDPVVMSQKDVKAANVAALLSGTLETSVKPYVRGLTVEDPAVVLRRAFKSPFPNAPNRSGTWVELRRARVNGLSGRVFKSRHRWRARANASNARVSNAMRCDGSGCIG
jgi:hypothetical protein